MGKKTKQESLVKVAVIQMEPEFGEKDRNVKKGVDYINEAADNGAQLIVLPELVNSGYVFSTRKEAFSLAEPIPDGETTRLWIETAQKRGVYISAGIAEKEGGRLYNSSVLVGPEGYIGTYRKVHLWYEEKLFFEPGNLGFPVFHTPIGRIAMIICYDGWFPESWRICALKGADIVCVNTNWVPAPSKAEGDKPMANYLCMTAAHSNVIFVAAADRVGTEREQPFLGCSIIVAPTGWLLAGPASSDLEEILYADCNLADARRAKSWNKLNAPLKDRRKDVYDEMLGVQDIPFAW
ncbi:MAG: N-carbamoyl-D-amino acid hydrolase [Syntrophomonadaceae bacterium]|nr:N-carbamoyl-D-amino acid hydrolase [Bacillota bacterium]